MITIAETAALEQQTKANRERFPPLSMAGIGHFQSALVPAFFGGLQAKGVIPSQPLNTAWDKITGFSHPVPDYNTDAIWAEGVIPSWNDDEITVAFNGLYQIVFIVSADAEEGADYSFGVFLNATPTEIVRSSGVIGASARLALGHAQPLYVQAGARIALYGSADQNGRTFDMTTGILFLMRVR